MDEISKFRLTGAAIWLLLLVLVVPVWYSNPVNFNPDSETASAESSPQPVVYQQYVLPVKDQGADSVELDPTPVNVKQGVASPVAKTHEEPKRQEPSELASKAPDVNKTPKPTVAKTPVSSLPEPRAGEWLVKVYASKDIKEANRVLGLLDDKYEVWIKEFPKSKSFSVRTGPYKTREAAKRDKTKIDKAIRTHSQIVQVE